MLFLQQQKQNIADLQHAIGVRKERYTNAMQMLNKVFQDFFTILYLFSQYKQNSNLSM